MRTIIVTIAALLLAVSAAAGERGEDVLLELDKLLELPGEESPPPHTTATAPRPAPPPASLSAADLYPEVRVRVTSLRHTILTSQAGGKVDRVGVKNGEQFKKGDLLVEIDPTFERLQLDRAKASLRRQELIREMTAELVALQAKGELELELVKADIDMARAEVNLLEARLERTRIVAPFDGRAGEVAVREFQVVAEGQALLEIIDEGAMELEFIVASDWMRWFKPGFAFEVRIDELDKSYRAEVKRLGGKVDPLSKSINVYAVLADAGGELMEGMSGEAFIAPPKGDRP